MKTLTAKFDLLSGAVELMITLPSHNRQHALNDRATNLLMKGKIDMNAVTGEADAPRFSDAGISGFLEQDTEVLITAAKKNYIKNKTRRCFSPVSKKNHV